MWRFIMDQPLRKLGLSAWQLCADAGRLATRFRPLWATRTLSSERDRRVILLSYPVYELLGQAAIYYMMISALFPGGIVRHCDGPGPSGILCGILYWSFKSSFKGRNRFRSSCGLPELPSAWCQSVVHLIWEDKGTSFTIQRIIPATSCHQI